MAQINVGDWIDKHKGGTYICLCQEPDVYQNKAAMQPRASKKYIGGNGNIPRSAIYTSKNIEAWYIGELSNRNVTEIVVKLNGRETLIICCYLDRNEDVIERDSNNTIRKTKRTHMILSKLACMYYGRDLELTSQHLDGG